MGSTCKDKDLDAVTDKLECRMAVSSIKDQLNSSGSVDVVYTNITTRLTCESRDLPRGCVILNNNVFWNHDYGNYELCSNNCNPKAQQVCILGKTNTQMIMMILLLN